MKSFAVLAIIVALAVSCGAASYGASSGSSYGGGSVSIPAPPCANNYLFSCQPHLSPAPCAPQAPSYGSSGAYTENKPVYVNAPFQGYNAPLQGLRGFAGRQY